MGDRAADGASVTDLRVADVAGRMSEQRGVLFEDGAVLNVHVASHGADGDHVAVFTDVGQIAETAYIDQHGGLGEAELHQRQQAVTASDELCLVTVLTDEADRLFGGLGTDVVELCGNHALFS